VQGILENNIGLTWLFILGLNFGKEGDNTFGVHAERDEKLWGLRDNDRLRRSAEATIDENVRSMTELEG
jgi:hypothetical protein